MSDTTGRVTLGVGIISCSGEEFPEGTIARLATLRVLGSMRPDVTATLCLPLFLAGEGGERNFAAAHPVITVDGCDKLCAKWSTEQYSGPVARSLVVSEILGPGRCDCPRSTRSLGARDEEAVRVVSERIASAVDDVLEEQGSE